MISGIVNGWHEMIAGMVHMTAFFGGPWQLNLCAGFMLLGAFIAAFSNRAGGSPRFGIHVCYLAIMAGIGIDWYWHLSMIYGGR